MFTLCDTSLEDLTDSSYFSVRDYFFLIRKDSVTHILDRSVHVKERPPLTRDLSLESSDDMNWFYSSQYLTTFSSINSPFLLCAQFLMLFHLI